MTFEWASRWNEATTGQNQRTLKPEGPVSVAVPSASAATVTAQCQVIKIGLGGDIVGHVYGNASTLNDAKKDANKYVPNGHYKRHCRGVGQHPSGYFPGGGGGFRGGSF